ncbi:MULTISPECIES: hypothetical protein [Saccharibacillus]|uniref:hypothetical protein n=1 Tax=Saccharibacillus TaxID=456492 RepID=UPI001239203B|nr:hypothetical protein [Saccharibacillus sp. WB 17]MWJ32833.1 hypothetical protein [Saccharibacillus sp. WB 17]
MSRKKAWMPAAVCLLALTACSPNEWAGQVLEDRIIQVKRYPDQQKPYVGYASAFKGYIWKKGGETELRQAWDKVPEAKSMGDPDEVDLTGNTSILVRQKTIAASSLEEIVEQAAAYEYKHDVSGIRIDSEIVQGDWVLASFPYRYRGVPYTGKVLARLKGHTYIYHSLNFSPELTDEGKRLPFVPGNGSMGVGEKEDREAVDFSYFDGSVNDERIEQIVIHDENGSEVIPIEADQLSYVISDDRDANGGAARDIQYIEALDRAGRTVYTWQY